MAGGLLKDWSGTALYELSNKFKRTKAKLEGVQARFLDLLESIPEHDMDRRFEGGIWTIKQELVHIIQAVEVLPAGIGRASRGGRRSLLGSVPTGLRNWVNGQIIVPWKARKHTRDSISSAYQKAHKMLVGSLENLKPEDWGKGMPYPRKYRTVEQMAQRPIEHFEEHEAHLQGLLGEEKGSITR